jgi:hypothetical protein
VTEMDSRTAALKKYGRKEKFEGLVIVDVH